MIRDAAALLARLRQIQAAIRDDVLAACERGAAEELGRVVSDDSGDAIFAIDRVAEEPLLAHFEAVAREWPLVLLAEGLAEEGVALPRGTRPADADVRVLVDPIDGTRGLIYQKRPAWVLTAVAPNRGPQTSLADVEIAVQTEIPLVRQHLSDCLWTVGDSWGAQRWDRLRGGAVPCSLQPSRAATIAGGYGGISRFFPGSIAPLAAVEDDVVVRILGRPRAGGTLTYNDQYASTGGQIYELIAGHERWVADLRPLVAQPRSARPLCCHPYDIGTERIARAAGAIITDERGAALAAPLNTTADVAWIGYSNAAIRAQVEPVLQAVLRDRGWL